MTAVVGPLPLELPVLERDAYIGRDGGVGKAVDGAQVELIALVETVVLAAVRHIAVGIDRLLPTYRVVAVARAVQATTEIASLARRIVGRVQLPLTDGGAVFDAEIHVVGQADIVVLIEEPALRDAVRTGSERHAIDTDLDLAVVRKPIAEPAGMEEVVALACPGRIPAVLEPTDDVFIVEREIDPKGVQLDVAAVAAAVRPGDGLLHLVAAEDIVDAHGAADGHGSDLEHRAFRGGFVRGLIRLGDDARGDHLLRDNRRVVCSGIERARADRLVLRCGECAPSLLELACELRDTLLERIDIGRGRRRERTQHPEQQRPDRPMPSGPGARIQFVPSHRATSFTRSRRSASRTRRRPDAPRSTASRSSAGRRVVLDSTPSARPSDPASS